MRTILALFFAICIWLPLMMFRDFFEIAVKLCEKIDEKIDPMPLVKWERLQ